MDIKSTIGKIKQLAESGECDGGNTMLPQGRQRRGTDAAQPSDLADSLEEVFARVYRATQKTLGITPFDEQLSAAIHLSEGKMVQMQTGEGKTLTAVFAACYAALGGEKVHILTFNDYLARRDCDWMRPIYDEMGVSLGCITENTPRDERGEIYRKQVVYTTAKEAGFDYLRDFVCFDTNEMVFPEKLNFAIVDEADSILIDEARIPLVIAGDVAVRENGDMRGIYEKLADFTDTDFEMDEDTRNVYLTDSGADKAEELFDCDIYDAENAGLLAKICACLKARDVLTENKDYIVKDGAIILIDEFTGRAAPGRVFPGELQAAAEAKHDLKITSRGRIMGNIALQYFARLYPKLSGMSGTAESAREEFEKFYGILTEVIPTRLPCKRVDEPLELYYDAEEKRGKIITAIRESHEKGAPVLVGTASISESESLAEDLRKIGIECSVLNAKNNADEAKIIAAAGERGAVTISTNMAGRGVDIKLGCEDGHNKDFVTDAGGLLVIATSMRESSRITQQLRGRAGRQGDPGKSRFFAALDDEIMVKFDLKGLCGRHYPTEKIEGKIMDKAVLREAERVQRISEGDTFDDRVNLMKYTMIGEKHRELTFRRRRSLLDGTYNSEFWQKSDLYEKAAAKFPEEELQTLQNHILAALLNEFWCDYLDYTVYLREGIHLTQIAGRNPAEEYNIACEEYYNSAAETIPERMGEKLAEVLECDNLADYRLDVPSRTYTYLLDDMGEEFKAKPILSGVFSEGYEPGDSDDSDEEIPDDSEKKGFFGRLFGKKKG
ncbi:MAG: preprotein translocase subunit SecA [Oscillospiraceae bacterium]|nr:preprotein translocase subunit SecA [Oscillospiraceae bacterium]